MAEKPKSFFENSESPPDVTPSTIRKAPKFVPTPDMTDEETKTPINAQKRPSQVPPIR
jgi:hypothetical protein